MKTLKFRAKLIEKMKNGEKFVTWRLFDDKDLQEGERVELINWEAGTKEGEATIINLREKKFKELTEEDKEGHEKFESDEEMYATYSKYYYTTVDENTSLKLLRLGEFSFL